MALQVALGGLGIVAFALLVAGDAHEGQRTVFLDFRGGEVRVAFPQLRRVDFRPDSQGQIGFAGELIWGGEMPRRDRSVDVLVRKVRAKLELVAPEWRYIHTHFGIGYRFTPEDLTDSSE